MGACIVVAARGVLEPRADGSWTVLENVAVLVSHGVIQETGSWPDMGQRHPGLPVVGGLDQVMMPGLINAHHHLGITPLQMGVPDLPLELWSSARLRMRGVTPYLDTLYSAMEMVASGVTCVQHLRYAQFGSSDAVFRENIACLRAYADIGMRVSLGLGYRDQNRIHHQMNDEDVVASMPIDLQQRVRTHLARFTLSPDGFFDAVSTLREAVAHNRLAVVQLAPPNLHWMSDNLLGRFRAYADAHGLLMHVHLDETIHQKMYARDRTGGSALQHLDRLGLANDRLTIGHGIWMTEADIDLVAEKGVHICHNCSSNLRLRSGIAPLNAFKKKGVNVAIGMDEAGLNDDRDMLLEMRLVLNVHRTPGMDSGVPTADQVLSMATVGGAATTPFGQAIGRIRCGGKADIVLLDWRRMSRPYLAPTLPLVDAIVRRAKTDNVRTVMIGGEVAYQDGRFTRIDEDDILSRIEGALSTPASDCENYAAQTSELLVAHLGKMYDDKVVPSSNPFYAYNSRF